MNFTVGSLVRFKARFQSSGKTRDPHEVKAVVSIDGESRTYSINSGTVVRRGEGVYTIDVLLERAGELIVRFDGDVGFGESHYEVAIVALEDGALSTPVRADVDEVLDDGDDRDDSLDDLAPTIRREFVAELADAGIDVEGRSDAFVRAAYFQHHRQKPSAPSTAHADAQRNAWRRPG